MFGIPRLLHRIERMLETHSFALARIPAIETRIERFENIYWRLTAMTSAKLDALQAELDRRDAAEDKALTLIKTLTAELVAAKKSEDTEAALDDVIAKLKAKTDAFAASFTADAPAPDAPVPEAPATPAADAPAPDAPAPAADQPVTPPADQPAS